MTGRAGVWEADDIVKFYIALLDMLKQGLHTVMIVPIITVCVFVVSILFWFPQCTHYFWRVFRFLFIQQEHYFAPKCFAGNHILCKTHWFKDKNNEDDMKRYQMGNQKPYIDLDLDLFWFIATFSNISAISWQHQTLIQAITWCSSAKSIQVNDIWHLNGNVYWFIITWTTLPN
jgi:hypothetical protein